MKTITIPDLTVTPMPPEKTGMWDLLMTSMLAGMTRDAIGFMLRRPDVIIVQVLTSDVSLSVMCKRIRNKIGFDPSPVWVRGTCRMIAMDRGLTSEP